MSLAMATPNSTDAVAAVTASTSVTPLRSLFRFALFLATVVLLFSLNWTMKDISDPARAPGQEKASISAVDQSTMMPKTPQTTSPKHITMVPKTPQKTSPKTNKHIFNCSSGCVDFAGNIPACLGGYTGNGGRKLPWPEQKNKGNGANDTLPFIIDGNVLAIFSKNTNIGHSFYDDLWSSIVWIYLLKDEINVDGNMTVIFHSITPWASDFLRLFTHTFHLDAYDVQHWPSLASRSTSTVCAGRGNTMYLNGFLRDLNQYGMSKMKQIRDELRLSALNGNSIVEKSDPGSRKERIVIYTRKDATFRRVLQAEEVVKLFDTEKYNVSVLDAMPQSFDDQVHLFNSIDLLVAPNGGWTPNVLWMKDDACIVELHLYKLDSWIDMFGLKGVIKDGHLVLPVGDYHPPNEPIVKRPSRVGGDDNISGSLVAPDIRKSLNEANSECARFLKSDVVKGNSALAVKGDSINVVKKGKDNIAWGISSWLKNNDTGSSHSYLEGGCETAGLGHSFMSFNHLVTLARERNLIPRFYYKTNGHGLNGTRVMNYFFGELFMSPIPTNVQCKKQLRMNLANTERNSCSIITATGAMSTPSEKGMESNLPIYRQLFQLNEELRKTVVKRKEQIGDSDHVTVAVHIRRGDLMDYLRGQKSSWQAENRLIAVSTYVSVLGQLFSKLSELGKTRITVRLYCEGMKPPSLVPDYNGAFVDLSKEISAKDPILNVTFSPGDADTLQAFDDMCFSDILITAPSGYSYVPSILCSTPVVLAIPFWHSYDYIPNAITLEVGKGSYIVPTLRYSPVTLTNDASFNESQFDLLWKGKYVESTAL